MFLDKIALTLAIIGGLNWGSVGLFNFDLVAFISGGPGTWLARILPHRGQPFPAQPRLTRRKNSRRGQRREFLFQFRAEFSIGHYDHPVARPVVDSPGGAGIE